MTFLLWEMDFRVDEGICGSSKVVNSDLSRGLAGSVRYFRADLTQEEAGIAQQKKARNDGQRTCASASHEAGFRGFSRPEADGAAASGEPLAPGVCRS